MDAAFKEGGELNDHELAERCPLLDACIRESLRYHHHCCSLWHCLLTGMHCRMMPPTPGGLERDVGPAGVTFAGYHFQTGTRVSMPFLALGRDPRHFKEPDSFRPVRWLNGEDMERMAFSRLRGLSTSTAQSLTVLGLVHRSFRVGATGLRRQAPRVSDHPPHDRRNATPRRPRTRRRLRCGRLFESAE